MGKNETLFSRNLRILRNKKKYTKKELAKLCNISATCITYYEKGQRTPKSEVLHKLAQALDTTEQELLTRYNEKVFVKMARAYTHFRIPTCRFEDVIADYFCYLFQAAGRLGGKVWPPAVKGGRVDVDENVEKTAEDLRKYLKLPLATSLPNLVEMAESMGILVYISHEQEEPFDSLFGFINKIPFIAIHDTGKKEVNRLRLARALVDYFLRWSDLYTCTTWRKYRCRMINDVAQAFLFPAAAAKRELGLKRTRLTQQMYAVAASYGMPLETLVVRAKASGIISSVLLKQFFIAKNKQELLPQEIPTEKLLEMPNYFSQVVYQGVSERLLSLEQGAYLLRIPQEVLRIANSSILPKAYEKEMENPPAPIDAVPDFRGEITELTTESAW